MINGSNIQDQASDEWLMSKASDGEISAFEILYDRYAIKLLKYASRFIDDKIQAEDLVHETFLKLLEKPQAFNQERRFSTWLYTVTGNLCKNHLRNNATRKRLNESITRENRPVSVDNPIDLKDVQNILRKVFQELNEKEQEVFVLRFEMELSLREISEIMRIPEGSVKSCLFYLLKKIAPQFKEYNHG